MEKRRQTDKGLPSGSGTDSGKSMGSSRKHTQDGTRHRKIQRRWMRRR